MSDKTIQKKNLKRLLGEFSIEIPALQRDYAQGRWAQKEIGERFVKALLEVLDGDKAKGLHLDFIYGYVEGQVFVESGSAAEDSLKKLILIDGQQRLTTLWLLHLYLYKRLELEGQVKESDDMKDWLGRFSYAARSGAKEFCQALLEQDFLDSEAKKPSDLIYDKSPLFGGMRLLRHDPTVAAMLNMLDWIHEKVEGLDAKNEQDSKPKDPKKLVENLNKITFDFFDMEQFELGEELYIKMNARGKPLSEYENIKALIEKELREKSKDQKDQEDVARLLERIDAEWSDYFYSDDSNSGLKDRAKLFDARGKRFDTRGKNFLHYGAWFFNLAKVFGTDGMRGKTEKDKQKLLDEIKRKQSSMEFYEVLQENLERLDRVMGLLKNLYEMSLLGGLLEYERLEFLGKPSFFNKLTYKEQCYFFALIAYCKKDSSVWVGGESKIKDWNHLLGYLRTVRSLVENHPESFDDYMLKFFSLIWELSEHEYDVGRLENRTEELRLYDNILALEVRKAKLIKSDNGRQWEEILNKLGRHPLLRGRVDFLLDFSDEDFDAKYEEYRQNLECKKRGQKVQKPTYAPNLQRFEGYVDVAMKLLDRDFLSKNLPLLQRAWLCMGDFGVYIDRHIYCGHYDAGFYEGDAFSARHNWHLLLSGKFKGWELQKPYFKKLLENLNEYDNREALCKRLQKIIKDFGLKQKAWWMQLLIKQKEHFKFLHDRVGIPQSNATRIRKIDGQEHKIELLPTKGCIENGKVEIRDVLGYGFYLYCQKRGILKQNESYTKEERPFYSGGIVPCFKINGKEVFCNSLKKPRKRKDGKGQIDEECIVIGDKSCRISLDSENDIFAEFEKVLKGAKDAGLLLNEATKI